MLILLWYAWLSLLPLGVACLVLAGLRWLKRRKLYTWGPQVPTLLTMKEE